MDASIVDCSPAILKSMESVDWLTKNQIVECYRHIPDFIHLDIILKNIRNPGLCSTRVNHGIKILDSVTGSFLNNAVNHSFCVGS